MPWPLYLLAAGTAALLGKLGIAASRKKAIRNRMVGRLLERGETLVRSLHAARRDGDRAAEERILGELAEVNKYLTRNGREDLCFVPDLD